jgi:hypothetical protein
LGQSLTARTIPLKISNYKMKSNKNSGLVIALDRIVIRDESGPVANVSKYGSAYQYVVERGDIGRVLFVYGNSMLCAFDRIRMALEVPETSVAPYEA